MNESMTKENMQTRNEKTLRAYALIHGITNIEVIFSGGGDSGQIDSVDIRTGREVFNNSNKIVAWVRAEKAFNRATNEWEEGLIENTAISIGDLIEEFVYADLEHTDVDWYNNEGGQGTWQWGPITGISFDVYQNITEVDLKHSEIRQLGEEADT